MLQAQVMGGALLAPADGELAQDLNSEFLMEAGHG
jgi:hypothetical protein